MGRFIITEEEKNRIKLLYEVALPPSESILVIQNKNPFKYDEYKDARRIYSKDLNDGDRFYIKKKYEEDIQNFVFNSIIKNNIQGKTIRLIDEDKIIKVSNVSINPNEMVISFDKYFYRSVNNSYPPKETFFYSLIIKPNEEYISGQIKDDYFETNQIINIPEKVKTLLSNFINYCRLKMDEFNNEVEFLSNPENIQELPDDFFNIYKVSRVKTDFK
jgi:hypothetical protein